MGSLVVIGTLLTDYYPSRFVFGIITFWMLVGAAFQMVVIQSLKSSTQANGNGKKKN